MIAQTGIAQQNGQLPHDTRPKTCQGGQIAEIYDTSIIRSTVKAEPDGIVSAPFQWRPVSNAEYRRRGGSNHCDSIR